MLQTRVECIRLGSKCIGEPLSPESLSKKKKIVFGGCVSKNLPVEARGSSWKRASPSYGICAHCGPGSSLVPPIGKQGVGIQSYIAIPISCINLNTSLHLVLAIFVACCSVNASGKLMESLVFDG